MRVFVSVALLLLAWLASSQDNGTSTLSYSQLLRLSVQWQQTVLDRSQQRRLSSAELEELLRKGEQLRLGLLMSLDAASSSLEASQLELTTMRTSYAEVSRLVSQLQTQLSEQRRQAFWRGLRNGLIAFLAGVALGAVAL
jgi:hypothetical protein